MQRLPRLSPVKPVCRDDTKVSSSIAQTQEIGGHGCWVVMGYAGSREYAAIIADALHHHHGWKMEVWCLKPRLKRLGPRQLIDRIPDPKSVVPCTCDFCSGRKERQT
jgi:hypothetical protein